MNKAEISNFLSSKGWMHTLDGMVTVRGKRHCKVRFTNVGIVFEGRNGDRGRFKQLAVKKYSDLSVKYNKITF